MGPASIIFTRWEIFFRNLLGSDRGRIVFGSFRVVWSQADFRLVPSRLEGGKRNLVPVWFDFLRAETTPVSSLNYDFMDQNILLERFLRRDMRSVHSDHTYMY